jgi:hypothetical protein
MSNEIDPDRPWLSSMAQRRQQTKVVKLVEPSGAPDTSAVFLECRKIFRKPNGDPWYKPDPPTRNKSASLIHPAATKKVNNTLKIDGIAEIVKTAFNKAKARGLQPRYVRFSSSDPNVLWSAVVDDSISGRQSLIDDGWSP